MLSGGAGDDRLNGGSGILDMIRDEGSGRGVRIDLGRETASGGDGQGDRITAVEQAQGSDQGDSLRGDKTCNRLWGGDGSDTIRARAGDDLVHGGAGRDAIVFDTGYGRDRILDFEKGRDRIRFGIGGLTSVPTAMARPSSPAATSTSATATGSPSRTPPPKRSARYLQAPPFR